MSQGDPLYSTAKELQLKIDEYFDSKVDSFTKIIGKPPNEKEVNVYRPTITGLVLHCGFVNRQSFYDMEKRPELSDTIKRARSRIENIYEQQLFDGNAGAIFALKNFGWRDRQDIHTNEEDETDGAIKADQDELKRIAKEVAQLRVIQGGKG